MNTEQQKDNRTAEWRAISLTDRIQIERNGLLFCNVSKYKLKDAQFVVDACNNHQQTAALREELQPQRTGFLREADGLKEYIKQLTEELQSLREENERLKEVLVLSQKNLKVIENNSASIGGGIRDYIIMINARINQSLTSNKE